MTQRFARSSAVAALLGLALGSCASPQDARAQVVDGPKLAWKVAAFGKPRAATVNMETLGKYVSSMTGGNFTIEVIYDSLAPPKEILDGVTIGAFEMGWVIPGYHPGKLPAHSALTLPFLPLGSLRDQIEIMQAYYSHPLVAPELARWSAQLALPATIPQYELMGRGKPIMKPEDFKGRRIHASGVLGDAVAFLGASRSSLPTPEMYSALERGLLDGMSLAYYALHSFKLHEISEWYTNGLELGIGVSMTIVNAQALEGLPPAYRKLMKDGVKPAMEAAVKAFEIDNVTALEDFRKRGLKEITISAEQRDAFVRVAAAPVREAWIAEMEAKNIPGRKLLETIDEIANQVKSKTH